MIAWSVAAAVGDAVGETPHAPLDLRDAVLCGAGFYILAAALAMFILPSVNEVPEEFPASLLWHSDGIAWRPCCAAGDPWLGIWASG